MGVLIGWLSSGNTIIEPDVAAFHVVPAGFVIDHLLLSVLGIALLLAVGYGLIGLLVGVTGGWLGERLQAAI
jgi:hypothetical protein